MNSLSFLSFLFESEHEDGFVHHLKAKKYLVDFTSRGVWDDPPDVNLFYMTISLTEQGFENSAEIIESFFNYVKALEEKLESGELEELY